MKSTHAHLFQVKPVTREGPRIKLGGMHFKLLTNAKF